jgi:hypothetical protein
MCNYLLNDCVVMRRREGGRRRDTGGERDVSIDRSWFINERRLLFYRHDARHISNPSATVVNFTLISSRRYEGAARDGSLASPSPPASPYILRHA